MPEDINPQLLLLVLDTVAEVCDAVSRQVKALSKFEVEDSFPSVPAGVAPVAMAAEVHFATFIAAFMGDPRMRHGRVAGHLHQQSACLANGAGRAAEDVETIFAAPFQRTFGAFNKCS